jgi:hypothetical protein
MNERPAMSAPSTSVPSCEWCIGRLDPAIPGEQLFGV